MAFKLEVFNPTTAPEVTVSHAARLDTLAGKTIGELWNGIYEGDKSFPVIRKLLQERFPTAKFIPYTEFPRDGSNGIDSDLVARAVKEKGCDAVIVGNGA